MEIESRIDFDLVRACVENFPHGDWQQLLGSHLHVGTERDPRARKWAALNHVVKKGGNYVFLFPEANFSEERKIILDGPGGRKIPFHFSSKSHLPHSGLFVAYAGKAANLSQRFQWHFSLAARNTGAQVQYGLVKSGVCEDRQEAVDFMLANATIFYRELSGDENAANRDLLELSLCAKFAPPFNIKSER